MNDFEDAVSGRCEVFAQAELAGPAAVHGLALEGGCIVCAWSEDCAVYAGAWRSAGAEGVGGGGVGEMAGIVGCGTRESCAEWTVPSYWVELRWEASGRLEKHVRVSRGGNDVEKEREEDGEVEAEHGGLIGLIARPAGVMVNMLSV